MKEKSNVLLIENQLYNNQCKYKKAHVLIIFLLAAAAATYLYNVFIRYLR